MELKLSTRRTLVILAAIGAAVAVLLAMTLSSGSASAAVKHKPPKHAVLHAVKADSAGTEANDSATADSPGREANESASESTGENTTADPDGPGGPDVGGDHQCPPACSPGESG